MSKKNLHASNAGKSNPKAVVKKGSNLEQQLPKDVVAEPVWKSFQIDVSEESLTKLSDTCNEQERHFSDIFDHEKVSLGLEDSSNVNYQISPSKERSKRHFMDFLCGFSEAAAASQLGSANNTHSGLSREKINNVKIDEPNISKYLKTHATFDESASLNQEKRDVSNISSLCRDSESSKESSRISYNVLHVEKLPDVDCMVQKNQEFGKELFVSTIELLENSALKNKLKEDIKSSFLSNECSLASSECRSESKLASSECRSESTLASSERRSESTLASSERRSESSLASSECHLKSTPASSECCSEEPVTELLSEKLLQNSGLSDSYETETTAEPTVTTSAVTLTSSHSSNDGPVTNSDPVESKTPVQNSETTFTLSSVATLNPRVSIATQTDSSFLKETKTENVSSSSCDNVEKKEPPLSSVSLNPDPSPPLPSSPITNTTPVPVDAIPFSVALFEEERSENVTPKDIRLDTSALPLPPEIVINDNPLPSISPSLGTTSELVQVTRELQEDTETSILQQESVSIPGSADTEPAGQQLVLDNMTDPNVLVQYLSNFDPSLLSQDVTFVIIQGTPDEPVSLPDDHNFIIEQTAISEPTERESANSSLIYTLQPQLDITTEAEVVITDSS